VELKEMKNNKQIYIFGHKTPDTDSVTASLSLSYLKNKLGYNTIPAILSPINDETSYVLNYFKVEEPIILEDVKIKVKDLDYSKNYTVKSDESIYNAYNYMAEIGISKVPVVDKKSHLLGIVSMKDIAKSEFSNHYSEIDTTYDNIISTLDGEQILKYNDEIKGKVLVAAFNSDTIIKKIPLDQSSVLIVGDRHDIIEYAINQKAGLLIITGGHKVKQELLTQAKENNVGIISIKSNTLEVARRFNLCNKVSTIMNNDKVLCINENEYLSEFIKVANKTRYSYYPVLDNKDRCLGILRYSDVTYDNKKQVILVDHNGFDQSALGLDEAEILEIIDHHNISSSIATGAAIDFLTKPYGSTNTIIYYLYKENNIEIPKNIAGLMLSGILSDTLILTSPTTTDKDKEAVINLASVAQVDYEKYGFNMLKASTSIEGKSIDDLLTTDFKVYPAGNLKYCLSQFFTVGVDEIMTRKEALIDRLNNISKEAGYEFDIFLATDILTNGSYVFYSEKAENTLKKVFNKETIEQGILIPGLVSRKKQLVPFIQAELTD
jgi:manganese-dependent inorganic pyrophosphatase